MAFLHLTARDTNEPHRAATTLELMFDLASVIAVAAAAVGLHHAIAEHHTAEGIVGFLSAFFMIWWSWMNYTWFASAYDDGSPGFIVLSLVAMFGALMIAAGIPAVFAHQPIYLCMFGFVVMRVAMALFWFGAASGDPPHRKTALSYGVGILMMQVYWIVFVFSIPPTDSLYGPMLLLGMAGELAVPAIAEMRYGVTTWHRHHIIERYGLLNIIVLGECFLAIAAMLATGDDGAPNNAHGILTAVTAAAVTFSMWALYFTREEHLETDAVSRALLWGYGHFAIFASAAATGAGMAVFHDVASGHAEIGFRSASLAIAVPLSIYLFMLWLIRDRFCVAGWRAAILPVTALIVVALPFAVAEALIPIAVVVVIAATLRRSNEGWMYPRH